MENKPTQVAAREWLIRHDPEAADFWANQPPDTDFLAAVDQNHADFGPSQPLAIPGRRYRPHPRRRYDETIVVDHLAHSPSHESQEMVVYHYLRDEAHSSHLALRFYMPVGFFEDNYVEVTNG